MEQTVPNEHQKGTHSHSKQVLLEEARIQAQLIKQAAVNRPGFQILQCPNVEEASRAKTGREGRADCSMFDCR